MRVNLGLEGKLCVVTGATRGIGAATVRMLKQEGASVLGVARHGADLALDVTAADAGQRVLAACPQAPWALVNAAGTTKARTIDRLTDADWQEQWELHVMGPMRLMRALAPAMAGNGGGRIVNVSSSSGKRPSRRLDPSYSVTKAAQLSLSRVFADQFAGDAVLVNAVTPGPVASPLWMDEGGLAEQTGAAQGVSRDEALDAQAGKVPLGRFAEPGEVADVIVFLASARASTVTGAAWSADGGAVNIIV
jgi:3-oxoacyl-[acyl-carrier protein] reductase